MLYEEAQWVGKKLQKYLSRGDKVLNLGSSTTELREVTQPHMQEFIFAPAHDYGIEFVHTDISEGNGVDIVGDLTDTAFLRELQHRQWNGLLCCNLLEHIKDRKPIVQAINELLKPGNRLILTVPYNYPYHLDPIDTMYRPTIIELKNLFHTLTLIESKKLIAKRKSIRNGRAYFHKNYFQQLKDDPPLFLRLIFRCFLPYYKANMWWITVKDLSKMFKPFSVTVAVFEK